MLAELRGDADGKDRDGADRDSEDGAALRFVVRHGQEDALAKLLGAVESARPALERLIVHHGDVEAIGASLRECMGLTPHDTPDTIMEDAWPAPTLGIERLREAAQSARGYSQSKTNVSLAEAIDAMLAAPAAPRFAALGDLVLTKAGEQRVKAGDGGGLKLSQSFTMDVQRELPWLLPAMLEAAIHVSNARDRIRACQAMEMSVRAITIARRMLRDWRALKHRRGLLDFDDIIARTADLLERDGGGGWVHYKLDQGIDHVLVDEAQDTSPDQWRVIESLTSEFFAGDGAEGRSGRRTVFAVGDPKQSIYSFQGAAPKGFAERRAAYRTRARDAAQQLEQVPLNLSFRSTVDVLRAVDTVFASETHRQGLLDGGDRIVHEARRGRDRGRVEIWPVEAPGEKPVEKERWDQPIDHVADSDPRARLAHRIAERVGCWLGGADPLEPRRDGDGARPGRAVRAGDILILVRKRDAFVGTLARALKDAGVPVAGEDRLALTEHIAIEDLIAAGRIALNPHDDLTLAALLKSPLLGLDEDDLFALAHGRPTDRSLYRTLRARRNENPRWRVAGERLHAWRMRVDTEPPFEFFSRMLGADGGRARLLARLGAQANDVIDEFLARAIEDRDAGLPGLEAFLADLTEEAPTIKREMDGTANEVRIMTVHAAKGMEAPVVFLACCGAEPVSRAHLPRLVPIVGDPTDPAPAPIAWVAPGMNHPTAVTDASQAARLRQEDEYRRLLYVGMTRAEDRLIVCGYRGQRSFDGTWHAMCHRGLVESDRCDAVDCAESGEARGHVFRVEGRDGAGEIAARWPALFGSATEHSGHPNAADGGSPPREAPPTPRWLERARLERDLPRPLAPSGATAVIAGDAEGTATRAGPILGIGGLGIGGLAGEIDGGADHERRAAAQAAMRRGTVVHRLLQVLPDLAPEERLDAARRYVSRACADLSPQWRENVTRTALRTLSDPGLAPLFEGEARTEVPIMGTLDVAGGPQAVSGVIDRMIVEGKRVLLVDFKTGHPPASAREIAEVHVGQMALYRALAAPLYPTREIACALVYTRNAVRYDLAPERMDETLGRILDPATEGLDPATGEADSP